MFANSQTFSYVVKHIASTIPLLKGFCLTLAALVVCSLGSAMTARADSIVLFNTGVTAPGMPAPLGSSDTHYAIIASPIGASAAIVTQNNPAWIANDPNSQWISILNGANTGPIGNYTYRTTFDLTGLNPATALITGHWSTDNPGLDILINGTSTGNTSCFDCFATFTAFSVNSGFMAGVNTLDFVVQNQGGPTGLRVELQGTASPLGTAVPEPATLLLLGTGLVGFAAKARERRKAKLSKYHS